MGDRRVTHHPILSVPAAEPAPFTWAGTPLTGHVGETLAAALAANGVRVFGHHPRDGAPQGLFCASGQCAQCLVLADGEPVKACVARLRPGQRLSPRDSLPVLPPRSAPFRVRDTPHHATRVLIVGGGPAGLSAAIRLDQLGVDCLVVDDKPLLGGKLVLQTHRFFGSFNAVHAGTRGLDIAARLAREAEACPRVTLWRGSTALAVFEDGAVGVLRGADERPGEEGQYTLVTPERLLVASGARERFFAFPGNTLPGVMGAGAFQTLLHRDLVRPAERVLVVGGGNVGLIAAYQAIQAGIEVVAVVDVMPQCGGYKVHQDKLARLGVPLHTRTTLVSVEGREEVESATIATVDDSFRPLPGSHRTLRCDAVLLAVGLEPAAELFEKARELGLPAFRAGDAEEVAEASSAIFAGRIRAQELALSLGATEQPIPPEWHRALDILRSRPGAISPHGEEDEELHGLEPVIHCVQEIPCDPCAASCPAGGIRKDPDDIRHLPVFVRDALGKACVGCEKCVTICPGQAITLVDERKDPEHPFVWVPFELDRDELREGRGGGRRGRGWAHPRRRPGGAHSRGRRGRSHPVREAPRRTRHRPPHRRDPPPRARARRQRRRVGPGRPRRDHRVPLRARLGRHPARPRARRLPRPERAQGAHPRRARCLWGAHLRAAALPPLPRRGPQRRTTAAAPSPAARGGLSGRPRRRVARGGR